MTELRLKKLSRKIAYGEGFLILSLIAYVMTAFLFSPSIMVPTLVSLIALVISAAFATYYYMQYIKLKYVVKEAKP